MKLELSVFAFGCRASPSPVTLLLLLRFWPGNVRIPSPLLQFLQRSTSNSFGPTHLICHVKVPSISVTASATSNSHGKIDLLYFQLTVITRSRSLPHKNEIGKCIQCPMKKAGFLTTGFSCQVEYPSPFSVGAALHRSVLGDLMSITSCLTRFFSLSH